LNIEESVAAKNIRADSYKLLADCYYCPDKAFVQQLHSLEGSAAEVHSAILKHRPAEDQIDLLKVDFTRLFVGPFELLAPPYGSVYLEQKRMVMGDSTVDVQQRYRQAGLDLSIKEVPDHIALELEFMYFLIFKEIEAIQTGNTEAAIDYQEKQVSFLQIHLAVWVSEFADKVIKYSQTDFYRNLARATQFFVEQDLGGLKRTSQFMHT